MSWNREFPKSRKSNLRDWRYFIFIESKLPTGRFLRDETLKELAKAQKQTERMFQAFIKGKRNGRNGR